MPYVVEKHGVKWVVKKKFGDGEKMGEHDSHHKAFAQLKALYAAEGGKKKAKPASEEGEPAGG